MSEQQEPRPVSSGPIQQPTTFEVWDEACQETVVFSEHGTTKWDQARFDPSLCMNLAGAEYSEECLYRHDSGEWTLVTCQYLEGYCIDGPTAKRLDALNAVRWLLGQGFAVPDDLKGLASEIGFKPGPPRQTVNQQVSPTPKWNLETRELWYGATLCKRYRQKAKNQTLILDAFEEEEWPARIYDPLCPTADGDDQQRLRDAVRGLNRNKGGLQFELDGTGNGILWRPTESPAASTAPDDDNLF